MNPDPNYKGSSTWNRYFGEYYPVEVAKDLINGWPNLRPKNAITMFIEKNYDIFHLDEIDDSREIKRLCKIMIDDFKKSGCITNDGLDDWEFEYIEKVQWFPNDEIEDEISKSKEPMTFETKVQKRGTATALYIPKKIERETGIEPGDLVEIILQKL